MKSRVSSDIIAPAALSAAPISGMITLRQRNRSAIMTAFSPPAPPPAIITAPFRVDALLDGDVLGCIDHLLGDQFDHGVGLPAPH